MNDIKPLVVVLDDRHNGKYSGGKWTAWNMCYVPSKIFSDEKECSDFFAKENLIYGRGETPEEAIEDLKHRLVYGTHMTKEYIKEVSESTEDEEEIKMKATSTEVIKNVNDICFNLIENNVEIENKLVIVASTNDDIFTFEFEGPNLLQCCKKAGMFNDWEKDQKIMELEKDVSQWKKEASDCLKLRDEAQKEAYKLKKKNEQYEEKIKKLEHDDMLDKNAADYWSKEHDILLERFAKLQVENERLGALKTPTIENFADEEPSSRRDILRCAEKCVCGHREQDYGSPESNFQLIADLWNGYLGTKYRYPDDDKPINISPLKPLDVSMMMALLKIARIKNGGGSGDSFVDLAGYAACGGEIWAEKKSQKDQN